jgi:hypothetical protein
VLAAENRCAERHFGLDEGVADAGADGPGAGSAMISGTAE